VGADNTRFWASKLTPYYPLRWTNRAYHCPAYKGAITGSTQVPGGWTYPFGSYAYNAVGVGKLQIPLRTKNLTLGLGWRVSFSWFPGRTLGTASEGDIKVPSEMFSIGESRWKADGIRAGGEDRMVCGDMYRPWNTLGGFSFDPARHGKDYNQLFCDGHVGAMSPWLLFNPTNSAPMWNYDHQPHPECWVDVRP
jgi:prepilin-type processing-associated H-X9-DG protein